jgi:4-carboxymuconolactone decarboxylase
LERLDDRTRDLVSLAAAIAVGEEPAMERAAGAALEGGVPPSWVDELLLQSILICGWPRGLTGARVCRQAGFHLDSSAEDATDYARHAEWKIRGEATCRTVYGETYEALRRNIHALHPGIEAAMIVEGYGRILGRPGLDLARRELCTIGQIAVQRARRQLRSHLKGALNAGASIMAISEVLDMVGPMIPGKEWDETLILWERVRG